MSNLSKHDPYYLEFSRKVKELRSLIKQGSVNDTTSPIQQAPKRARQANQPSSDEVAKKTAGRRLPAEIVLSVIRYLPFKDRALNTGVCRAWRNWIRGCPLLWTHLDLTPYKNKLTTAGAISLFRNAGRHLESVRLDDCKKLTSPAFSTLSSGRPNLKVLSISDIYGSLPAEQIPKLVDSFKNSLTELTLQRTKIDDDGLKLIMWSCLKLESLDVSNCDISGIGIVRGFEKVIKYAKMSKKPVEDVIARNSLKKLDVSFCPLVGNPFLVGIASLCPNLEDLRVERCSSIRVSGMFHLHKLRNLKSIILRGTETKEEGGVSLEAVLYSLADNLRQLSTIAFSHSQHVYDAPVIQLVNKCPLSHVYFKSCVWITGASIEALAQSKITNLVHVVLSACPAVNMDSVITLLMNSRKSLKNLDLSNNAWVDDRCFPVLAMCYMMVRVDFSKCDNVTGVGILQWADEAKAFWKRTGWRPSLSWVGLNDCNKISLNSATTLRSGIGRPVFVDYRFH
ncbi:hypothetical protein BJ742DRAFT_802956 [Cladochytrium replicatum]|nr:hypothetical protein BJ742DRAFT_802956 [Cladochytrium replicatum]